MANKNNWKDQFIDRDNELKKLIETWEDVKSGKPNFTILLGDTGVGKTRLVQNFYNHLSQEDNTKYWPSTLSSEGKTILINPKFSEDNAFIDTMPWFWWGLRFLQKDSDIRNASAVASELPSALQNDLLPHILYMIEYQKRYEKLFETGNSLLKASMGVVDLVVTAGWMSATSSLATAAKSLNTGLYEDIYNVYKGIKESESSRQSNPNLIKNNQITQEKDMQDRILDYFETVIFSKKGLSIPAIIILDDAQWIDIESLIFIKKLYGKAIQNNWPLYIIATHWKSEWSNNVKNNNTLANLCTALDYEYLQENITHLEIVENKNSNEFSQLIMSAIPGLTPMQCKMISDRVQGNFGFLNDLIDEILDDTDYFENDNIQEKLTQDGIDALKDIVNLEHFELWEKKFNKLDKKLKKVLSWSSYQGREFFHAIVLDIANKIDDDSAETITQLRNAREKYSLIEGISEYLNEFPHSALYEIAHKNLKNKANQSREFELYYNQVLFDWLEEKNYENLPYSEKEKFLLLVQKEIDHGMVFTKDNNFKEIIILELMELYNQTKQINKLDSIIEKLISLKFDIGLNKAILILSSQTLSKFSRYENSIKLLNIVIAYFEKKEDKSLDELIELIQSLIRRGAQNITVLNEDGAREDYQNVIDIISLNKKNIEEKKYAATINYLLASVYEARAMLEFNSGYYTEAINNYTRAIEIKEEFIINDNIDTQWIVNVYMTRGVAKRKNDDIVGAIEDYTLAINIGESFNQKLTKTEVFNNGILLASCYMNRAVAYKLNTEADKALVDYDIAIENGKNLKIHLENLFSPKMQVDLIRSYMNRANIYNDNNPEQAFIDNSIALDLSKDLEKKLGQNFLPDMKSDLARIYFHLSLLTYDISPNESYSNLSQGIQIMENMKKDLGRNFSKEMNNNLQMYYKVQDIMNSVH